MWLIQVVYTGMAMLLALYGLNALLLAALHLGRRTSPPPCPPEPAEWPWVTVQLPIYNEMYVADRVIRAAARLDYPRERLEIQVLDDSDDETTEIVAAVVAQLQRRGVRVVHLRRRDRNGYKAGALAWGLQRARGEFVAVFDADFVPPRDWLKRTLPYLLADKRLGFVQTRWEHLNPYASPITLAQTLALDGHFAVEQAARQAMGWPVTFNGSAGLWRRACIEDSGNWQADTLCEDLDLAYRAQLAGWRGLVLTEPAVPAEVPPLVAAFRQQQARWAMGSIQVLRKVGRRLWRAPHLSWWARWQGLMHLSGYLVHPLLLFMFLLTPLVARQPTLMSGMLAYIGLAGLGPPLVYALGQWRLRRSLRRLIALPILVCLGLGIAWASTLAVIGAFWGREVPFLRTPKFRSVGRYNAWQGKKYSLSLNEVPWGECGLTAYAFGLGGWAWWQGLGWLLPFVALYALAFGLVATAMLFQAWQRHHKPWTAEPASPWSTGPSRRRPRLYTRF